MNLLHALCIKHSCSILLLAHPSRAGAGSGTSGSTDWSNGVRSRVYFETAKASDGAEPSETLRTFKGMKNNRGKKGGPISVEWQNGLYVFVKEPASLDQLAAEQKADDVFLKLLKQFTIQNMPVRATSSRSGPGALFSKTCESQGLKAKDFEAAMHRLLGRGAILNELETTGPPSKRDYRLVIP